MTNKLAAIVTTSDPDRLRAMIAECSAAAAAGARVRVFFRDESIPFVCLAIARERTGLTPLAQDDGPIDDTTWFTAALEGLASTGDVALTACSSSLYVWGVGAADLVPSLEGARGLVAFLADDLDGADRVLSY